MREKAFRTIYNLIRFASREAVTSAEGAESDTTGRPRRAWQGGGKSHGNGGRGAPQIDRWMDRRMEG